MRDAGSLLRQRIQHLASHPRKAIAYYRQEPGDSPVNSKVDSDWAGDKISRRSTSGMMLMRGSHLLRHSSTLQTSISLSSAEAEYYAIVRGACYGLGLQSTLRDWGLEVEVHVYSDSSSARSFAKRRGLGKQRHVQTHYLWLQDRVQRGHLQIRCIKGTENPADLLTKPLNGREIEQHCAASGVVDIDYRGHAPLPGDTNDLAVDNVGLSGGPRGNVRLPAATYAVEYATERTPKAHKTWAHEG